MKALYIKGDARLSDELRERFRGCRIENADAFSGVAHSVTEAEVVGDYPAILAALIDAGVKVVGGAEPEAEPVALYDVHKLTDGVRGKRASKANIPLGEAEQYVADRPDDAFEIALSE